MTIKITKNGLTIWNETSQEPALTQSSWPDGTAWESDEQALAWAELYVLSQNENHPTVPGDNPQTPEKPRRIRPKHPETGEEIGWSEFYKLEAEAIHKTQSDSE